MRITVGTIIGLLASGRSLPEILAAYPYLEEEDVRESLSYIRLDRRFDEIKSGLVKPVSRLLRRREPDKTHDARMWLPSHDSQLTEVLVKRENNLAGVLSMHQDGGSPGSDGQSTTHSTS